MSDSGIRVLSNDTHWRRDGSSCAAISSGAILINVVNRLNIYLVVGWIGEPPNMVSLQDGVDLAAA